MEFCISSREEETVEQMHFHLHTNRRILFVGVEIVQLLFVLSELNKCTFTLTSYAYKVKRCR